MQYKIKTIAVKTADADRLGYYKYLRRKLKLRISYGK